MSTKKQNGIGAKVELVIRELISKRDTSGVYGFYAGCYVFDEKGEIIPKKFITFFKVHHDPENTANPNTINRNRQRVLQRLKTAPIPRPAVA